MVPSFTGHRKEAKHYVKNYWCACIWGITLNTAAELCRSQLCHALNSSAAMIPPKDFSHPFCFALLSDSRCTVFFLKGFCFAAGAWAVVLGAGILVLSTSPHNFFCSTICSKIKLRSSLPGSFLPPLGSHTRFSKQYVKGLSSGCLCIMQMRQGLSREITACIGTTEIDILLYVFLYIFINIK